MGYLIGEVMVEKLRRGDLLVRSFLCAKVMVDLNRPLITSMWIERPDKDPVWIKVKYKRL